MNSISRFQVTMGEDCAYRYRGQPATCRLDVARVTVNGMDHEFIQLLEGSHPTGDYIAADLRRGAHPTSLAILHRRGDEG